MNWQSNLTETVHWLTRNDLKLGSVIAYNGTTPWLAKVFEPRAERGFLELEPAKAWVEGLVK